MAGGLRERKNARTLEAIERAAFALAAEQGFDHTTVAQIAERADVAPRTVFTRYPTKEAIVFGHSQEATDHFLEIVVEGEGDIVDRLVRLLRESSAAAAGTEEHERLRWRTVLDDPYLRRTLRGQLDTAERLIAEQVAREVDRTADDPGIRVFAAGVTGLFMTLLDDAAERRERTDPAAVGESGLRVLRAGLDALHP